MVNIIIKLFFGFLLLLSVEAKSTEEHKIIVKIKGATDSTLTLAFYFGDKIKVQEKAIEKELGIYIFEGDDSLQGGIYMIVNQNNSKLFEFIIDGDQKFILNTAPEDYTANMKVSGNKENKLFFRYLLFNESIYKSIKKLNDSINKIDKKSKEYKLLTSEEDSLRKILESYKTEIIDNNKGTFLATLLLAMEKPEIPEYVKNSQDSLFAFRYYKKHYWDNFDLSDSRLLRTPLFTKRVDEYFKDLVVLNPDSVIKEIDYVISLAKQNKETVSYLVWHFTSEYQNPKYLGFDKVFVHLVDNYFTKREIDYTTPSILKALENRANVLRPLLIGKKAPNLILIDTSGNYNSFYSINNDYTILLFWDYNCGVCKSEIKKLKKTLQENTKYDIAVYAINTNNDLDKWKNTIKERGMDNWINVNGTKSVTKDFRDIYDINRTPVIYLLDKDKIILAKKLAADKILFFLDNKM